jgi:serine protease
VAGTAQATILPVKVLDKYRGGCSGSWASVANGITYAADPTQGGADIISMSLGCNQPCYSSVVSSALAYAAGKDVLSICAAGNDYGGAVGYPAADQNCMAVSALNSDGSIASYSSVGGAVEISAPGTGILSTYNNGGYTTMSGTSMATPHVSGTAALVLSVQDLSAAQLRSHLKATAVDLGHLSSQQGAGAVNACLAVGGTTCGSSSGGGGGDDDGGDGGGETGTLHTHDIRHASRGPHFFTTIWASDGAESSVSGVTVDVEVCKSGGSCATGSGSTGSTGAVEFKWHQAGSGTYTTCVTGMAKSGYTWDSAAGHASGGNCHTTAV